MSKFFFEFGTLFAIINPYGLAFVFLNRTMSLSDRERAIIARQVAIYAFGVLAVSNFAGTTILEFFGIFRYPPCELQEDLSLLYRVGPCSTKITIMTGEWQPRRIISKPSVARRSFR